MIAEMVFKVMLVLGDKLATRTLQKFLVFNVRSGMLPKVILFSGDKITLLASKDFRSSHVALGTKTVCWFFRVEIFDVPFEATFCSRLVITVRTNVFKVTCHMILKLGASCS